MIDSDKKNSQNLSPRSSAGDRACPSAPSPEGDGQARGEAAPSLEYIYSCSPTSLKFLDFLDSWREELTSPPLPASRYPARCPFVKRKVLIVRGYPLSMEWGCEVLYKGIVLNLTCGRWSCRVCAKRKVSLFNARAATGLLVKTCNELLAAGYKYPLKMFHLTLPGQAWRDEFREKHGINYLKRAVEELRKYQNNLIYALQKRHYGKFHYICTVEPHRDGWPHLHILMCSESIARSKPLHNVKRLWCEKYGMGFVYVTVRANQWNPKTETYEKRLITSAQQGISYATKYMWKGLENYVSYDEKGRRKRDSAKLISFSKGAIGSSCDIVDDKGFPVFVQLNRADKADIVLDMAHREIDSYELFRTKSVAEVATIRYSLGGVVVSRVKGETYCLLKEEFPHAMLPEVYVRKCPVCKRSVRHCGCGVCTRCGLPRVATGADMESCHCVNS